MTKSFDDYEVQARHLAQISETLAKGSPEYLALQRAGLALTFAITRHPREFQRFFDEQSLELTTDEKEHLRRLGLK